MDHDTTDLGHYLNILDWVEPLSTGEPGEGAIPRAERDRANGMRDQIATEMWNSYQQYLHNHPEVLEEEFNEENI